jgi:hypothetical protein
MVTREVPRKLGVWLRRYGPAELLSLTATVCASWLALALSDSVLVAALAATWAENLAYYGLIVARELWAGGRPSGRAALRSLRDLLLEFGPAELLDSLLVRPTALAAGMALLPAPWLAALAGKLAADLVFYVPTIVSYELIRRRDSDLKEAAQC